MLRVLWRSPGNTWSGASSTGGCHRTTGQPSAAWDRSCRVGQILPLRTEISPLRVWNSRLREGTRLRSTSSRNGVSRFATDLA